ncbi:hypothetical protein [Rhizobium sp. L1K21]|uniref:hypothetical protein n=1 Tax=Rhizobium sp. L1K21 TaxID=2954933 RepID=UPI0020929F69|nr:hypothetical protein [Rhizobium sp. L1K21]MCO6188225.1 hypothetical protein [Rhizobium sp. L1K21]
MNRLHLEPNPINFELMHEILSGANPELRARFTKLGRSITQKQLDELAKEFLPHHFGDSIFDKSTTTVRDDLEDLMRSLEQSRRDLDEYATQLSTSSERFRSMDPKDEKAIRLELTGLAALTDQQKLKGQATLGVVSNKLESVRAVAAEVDDVQTAKFTHSASGLGNRRAFNKRMASLFAEGSFPGEYSLIFGKISGFDFLDRADAIKPKEALLARVGKSVSAITTDDDFGGWIDTPHIAILLATAEESEIVRLVGQVANQLQTALKNLKTQSPFLPLLSIAFGASTTYSAKNAASMIQNTEAALAQAIDKSSLKVVIFGQTTSDMEGGKDYRLYNGGDTYL